MQTNDKNAAYWLDRACTLENEGKTRQAEMALNAAIKRDDEEKGKSLPRG